MQSQFSTSSVSNRNIQHGDTEGANPAQAPQVSNSTFINDNDPRLDQETTRGIFWRPTQNQESLHSPENDHELHLPIPPRIVTQIVKKESSITSFTKAC